MICCISLAVLGVCMAISKDTPKVPQNTISAATMAPLPFDLQLSQMRNRGLFNQDTVYIDNSRVDTVIVTKTKVKYKERLVPVVPDSLPKQVLSEEVMDTAPPLMQDSISNYGNREEKAQDRSIILTVDGEVVYRSEHENHSTGGSQ